MARILKWGLGSLRSAAVPAGGSAETLGGADVTARAISRSGWKKGSGQVTRAILAIVVALIAGGIVLLLLGRDLLDRPLLLSWLAED